MPSATRAPLKQRLQAPEALAIAKQHEPEKQRLENLEQQILQEKAGLEKVAAEVSDLYAAIAQKRQAIEAEAGKDAPDQKAVSRLRKDEQVLQGRLAAERQRLNLDGVEARLQVLNRTIVDLGKKLTSVSAEFKVARDVLLAEARIGEGVAPSILVANDQYVDVVGARQEKVEAVRTTSEMKAVEAIETVITPFLAKWKKAFEKADGTNFKAGKGLGLAMEDYLFLDYTEAHAFAEAFKQLKDGDLLATDVMRRLETYQAALQTLLGDISNIHKHLPALEKAFVRFSTIPNLLQTSYKPEQVTAIREKCEASEKALLEHERPAVIRAEKSLLASLSSTRDDERLVDGRVAEAVEEPEKRKQALLEQLDTPEQVNAFVLTKLQSAGIPMTEDGLNRVLTARRQLTKRLTGASKVEDAALIRALRDDVVFSFFGASEFTPEQVGEITERLEDLKWAGVSIKPQPELLEIFLHGSRSWDDDDTEEEHGDVYDNAPPSPTAVELPPESNREDLQEVFDEYFSFLEESGLNASTDELQEPWKEVLADEFSISELLDGTMLREQKESGVTDVAVLRKLPEYYGDLLAKLEGIPVPDVAALKRTETQWVQGFIASMRRAEELKKELDVLQKGRQELEKSPAEGKALLEKTKKIRAELALIEERRRDVFTYLLKRDMAFGDVDTTERKRLQDNWSVTHPAEIAAKEAVETAAARAHGVAVEEAERAKNHGARKRLQEEIGEIEQLNVLLTQVTMGGRYTTSSLELLATNQALYEPILKQLPDSDIDGKKYTVAELVSFIRQAETMKPLASIREPLPAIVRSLDMNKVYGGASGASPEEVINAAYEFANDGAREGIALATWFKENYNGKSKPSATGFSGWLKNLGSGKDKAWEDELRQRARSAIAELERAQKNAVQTRKDATDQSVEAHRKNESGAAALGKRVSDLRQREKELTAIVERVKTEAQDLMTVKTDQVLKLAYDALHEVTRQVTGKQQFRPALSSDAFNELVTSLSASKPDPILIQRLVATCEGQKIHTFHAIAEFSSLAGRLTSGPEVDLPGKRQKLAETDAEIAAKEQVAEEKRLALEAATAEVARIKAETVDERLVAFDLETSKHISTVLDPATADHPQGLLALDEYELEKGLAEVNTFRAKVKERFDTVARLYQEWLDKKLAMGAARREETESEKAAFEPVEEEEKKIFALFEKQGAKADMTGAQFNAWYVSLSVGSGDKFKALVKTLVPGLS